MEFVHWTSFARIVDRYSGNAGIRRMTCADQFRITAFARLTWRESLRDIEVTLGANANKLYSMGLRHSVYRATLADANDTRDWRISADIAALLPPALESYIMERGYLDFNRFYALHQAGAFFVTRAQRNLDGRRVYSAKTDRTTGVICDQVIALNGFYVAKGYPDHLWP